MWEASDRPELRSSVRCCFDSRSSLSSGTSARSLESLQNGEQSVHSNCYGLLRIEKPATPKYLSVQKSGFTRGVST